MLSIYIFIKPISLDSPLDMKFSGPKHVHEISGDNDMFFFGRIHFFLSKGHV